MPKGDQIDNKDVQNLNVEASLTWEDVERLAKETREKADSSRAVFEKSALSEQKIDNLSDDELDNFRKDFSEKTEIIKSVTDKKEYFSYLLSEYAKAASEEDSERLRAAAESGDEKKISFLISDYTEKAAAGEKKQRSEYILAANVLKAEIALMEAEKSEKYMQLRQSYDMPAEQLLVSFSNAVNAAQDEMNARLAENRRKYREEELKAGAESSRRISDEFLSIARQDDLNRIEKAANAEDSKELEDLAVEFSEKTRGSARYRELDKNLEAAQENIRKNNSSDADVQIQNIQMLRDRYTAQLKRIDYYEKALNAVHLKIAERDAQKDQRFPEKESNKQGIVRMTACRDFPVRENVISAPKQVSPEIYAETADRYIQLRDQIRSLGNKSEKNASQNKEHLKLAADSGIVRSDLIETRKNMVFSELIGRFKLNADSQNSQDDFLRLMKRVNPIKD